ncbi:peptidoglycan DD-metalloendopeptidase family protein [Candidatus Woesearchaeota archaeon]|nr:peptidoglycan DD-metalloendopeptidase family protein [Candidatus Woesearchaeota archaeon]
MKLIRTKKASNFIFQLTVFFIFLILPALFFVAHSKTSRFDQIGEKQVVLLDTYEQGELPLFYIDQAIKHMVNQEIYRLVSTSGGLPGDCYLDNGYAVWNSSCVPDVSQMGSIIKRRISDDLHGFFSAFPVSMPLPEYDLTVSSGEGTTKIIGKTGLFLRSDIPEEMSNAEELPEYKFKLAEGMAGEDNSEGYESMHLIPPVSLNQRVTSCFEDRKAYFSGTPQYHNGIDYVAVYGTDVYAVEGGAVVFAGYDKSGYGNKVVISHKYYDVEYWTLYGHLSSILVTEGDTVEQGEVIAKSGNSGNSIGAHLHFEIRALENLYKNAINPLCLDPGYLEGFLVFDDDFCKAIDHSDDFPCDFELTTSQGTVWDRFSAKLDEVKKSGETCGERILEIAMEGIDHPYCLGAGLWSTDSNPPASGQCPALAYENAFCTKKDWEDMIKETGKCPTDCGVFTQWVFNRYSNLYNKEDYAESTDEFYIDVRTANWQAQYVGRPVDHDPMQDWDKWQDIRPDCDKLQKGDLIFFSQTYGNFPVSHVGIYAGECKFIHAGDPVQIADLSQGRYNLHYIGAKRVCPENSGRNLITGKVTAEEDSDTVLDADDEVIETESFTCEDFNGIYCSEDELCTGDKFYAEKGVCCLGECRSILLPYEIQPEFLSETEKMKLNMSREEIVANGLRNATKRDDAKITEYLREEPEQRSTAETIVWGMVIVGLIILLGLGIYYIKKKNFIVISLFVVLLVVFVLLYPMGKEGITGHAVQMAKSPLSCSVDDNMAYFTVGDYTPAGVDSQAYRYYSHCISDAGFPNHENYFLTYMVEAFEKYPNLKSVGYTPLLFMTKCYVESSRGPVDGCNQAIVGGMCQVDDCPAEYPDCRLQENTPKAIHDNILAAASILSNKVNSLGSLQSQFGLSNRDMLKLIIYSYNRGEGTVMGGIDYGDGPNTGVKGYLHQGKTLDDAMLLACYELYDLNVYGTCGGSREYCCRDVGGVAYASGVIGEYENRVCPLVTRTDGVEPIDTGEEGITATDTTIPEGVMKGDILGYYYLNPSFTVEHPFDIAVFDKLWEKTNRIEDECAWGDRACIDSIIDESTSAYLWTYDCSSKDCRFDVDLNMTTFAYIDGKYQEQPLVMKFGLKK